MRDVPHEMAVEDPVSGSSRRPGDRHRRAGHEPFGHGGAPLVAPVAGVPSPVTDGIDVEVEAMEVHRVFEPREVDPVPAERITLRDVDALGVRPRATVDDEGRSAETARARRIQYEPPADDEHAVTIIADTTGRIDHDCAVELRILGAPTQNRGAPGFPRVVVGAGLVSSEADFSLAAGLDANRVASKTTTRPEAEHREGFRERVPKRNTDLGPRRHADKRPRVLEQTARLRERGNRKSGTLLAFRVPHAVARLEAECEDPVLEFARRRTVVVDTDRRSGGLGARDRLGRSEWCLGFGLPGQPGK